MRKILKRSMAWLLIVAMFVGLIPYAAFANDGGTDVSEQFKITDFSVKLDNHSTPAYELGESGPTVNPETFSLSSNMNVPLVINLSFEPKDAHSAQDLQAGDYMIFDLFSVEKDFADKIDQLTIASDKLDFGTAEIIKSEQGGRTLFQVKVTLTEAINAHKDLKGILAPNGRVNGLNKGETMTLQKDGQPFATINGRDPSTFDFYRAPLQVTSKDYSWHWGNGTPARIQWDLTFEQEIPTQFENYQDAENGTITSSIKTDMILVETLDEHQTFGDEPVLNFEYHAYLYDAERTLAQKNADKANKLVYPYLDHDQEDTVYPDVESNLTLEDLEFSKQQDEAAVRATAKSWAIVTDDNGCEKLIINFGTPGSTGLKYSDIFNEDQHEQLLAGFDAELKHIDEMIEKAGENPNDMTHISDSITGQDMTIADWKKFKQIYEDSKEYYQNLDDKYVYGFTAKLQTYVKFNEEANRYDRDTLLTEKVVNKYQMEGLTKDLFASCNNFWRNAMVAVAKPGDVVLFKTDSSANISAADLNEDTVLDQPVPGAEFQVYAKDSDTPLTFTKENDGRYKLDTNSEVTNLPTDEYGQLIVTGLKDGGEYYFKEVKAPAGYELNAEPIAFTISNTEIRYVLAKNDLKATYTVTYEYEGTVPENAPALPEGSTNYQGDKITVAEEPTLDGYTFTGWTVESPGGVEITDGSVTMPEGNVVLVGTWQRNIEGTITVTPADITIYMGGNDGYEAVVGGEGNTALTTNNSLPEPLFYIEGPEGATLNVTDLAFSDGATEAGKDATGKTLYRLEATAEDQLPVRVQYINADGEAVISDVFEPSAELFATYDIKMYYGENDPESIKASTADGKTYDVKADATGKLTVRAVDDTNNSAADNPVHLISETLPSERLSAGTAAVTPKEENTTYTLNNTTVPVKNPAAVGLLFDTIIDDDGHDRSGALKDKVDSEMGNASYGTTRHYQSRYLDLVDEDNGNAWVKASGPVTVTWAYPEDTGKNTDFTLYHFKGLHRDDSTGGQSGFELDDLKAIDPEEVTITKTDAGIQFEVGSGGFSPFVLVWEEADDDDNPPYIPPTTGDDDDDEEEPDTPALDRVNHFLYVEGYPEDYRTGEYSDNENLWPVKPQGNITRAEVATIFYRLLKDEVREEIETDVSNFPDVDKDDWFNVTVSSLANMGAISGYEDGTFRPNEPISRAELAAMAVRFYDAFEAEYEEGTFLDVDGDEWYADAIAAAEELGILGGYPDGTVRPNNNITRAETCAIVNRVLERRPHDEHLGDVEDMRTWPDNQPGAWYYADMQEATNGHYYEWIDIDGSKFEEWTEVDKDYDWTKR